MLLSTNKVARESVEDAKFVVMVGRLSCTWYMRKG